MKFAFGDSAIAAVLGYLVVFVGLVLLLCVVIILGRIMTAQKAKKEKASAAEAARTAPLKEVTEVHDITDLHPADHSPAPGSAGAVKLYDVPDRTAAMLMAIVADSMGRPVNELRFKSIKELK